MASELHHIPNLIQLRLKYSYQKRTVFFSLNEFSFQEIDRRPTEQAQRQRRGRIIKAGTRN